MIIQCQSCAAKYFLPEEKVPVNPLKVRCPKCRAVFMLAGKRERVPVGAGVAAAPVSETAAAVAPSPVPEVRPAPRAKERPAAPPVHESAPVAEPEPGFAAVPEPAPYVEEAPVASAPVEPAAAAAPPAGEKAKTGRGAKSADDRAKRLARVLVSDILWYNRERRDAALRDGTLMTSLGEEIKKSWELYKEKVGPEAAHSTNYFKEALNEILADGQQVF
jgi:predicted Zn finger-like uncharacterized protein